MGSMVSSLLRNSALLTLWLAQARALTQSRLGNGGRSRAKQSRTNGPRQYFNRRLAVRLFLQAFRFKITRDACPPGELGDARAARCCARRDERQPQRGEPPRRRGGAGRAGEIMMATTIARLLNTDADRTAIEKFIRPPLRSWNGISVGEIRPTDMLRQASTG